MQSAFRTAHASLPPPLSPSTARANDLATGCRPLQSPCPPATLRMSRTPSQFLIPSLLLPPSSSRATQSPQSRSARPSAFRELLCAWRSTPRPVRPTSLFSRPPSPDLDFLLPAQFFPETISHSLYHSCACCHFSDRKSTRLNSSHVAISY